MPNNLTAVQYLALIEVARDRVFEVETRTNSDWGQVDDDEKAAILEEVRVLKTIDDVRNGL